MESPQRIQQELRSLLQALEKAKVKASEASAEFTQTRDRGSNDYDLERLMSLSYHAHEEVRRLESLIKSTQERLSLLSKPESHDDS